MYAQEVLVPGTAGKTHATVNCYGCGKYGHYLSHCPEENGQQNLNVEDEPNEEGEDVQEDEGAQNMHIGG